MSSRLRLWCTTRLMLFTLMSSADCLKGVSGSLKNITVKTKRATSTMVFQDSTTKDQIHMANAKMPADRGGRGRE